MRLLCCVAALCWVTHHVAPAQAQGWDDAGDDGGAIVDPELEGVAPPPAPMPPVPTLADGGGNGELRMALRNRTAMDVFFQDPREDILTSTWLLDMEASVRRSDSLRFVVGARPIYRAARRRRATPEQGAVRYELDVLPSAAYGDVNPAPGLHLRVGYQYLHLGRFDVFSAQNVLSAFDLREGPTSMPEASELSQPAVRIDWDPNLWLSLRAVYVPFFQPHLVAYTDGDYALAPSTQAAVDASIDANGVDDPRVPGQQREQLKASLSRSGQAKLTQAGFAAFAPDTDPSMPQAAVRGVMHGPTGELAMTVSVANERLPAPHYSEALAAVLSAQAMGRTDAAAGAQVQSEAEPLKLKYNRFFVTAVDGATQLGPVQVGAELAMLWNRTMFAARQGEVMLPERVHVAQAGLRLEYVLGQRLALVSEAFWSVLLSAPDDPDRQWLMADGGRSLRGIIGFASYAVAEAGLTLELGAAAMSGPSYAILPRVQWQALEALFVEAGAQLINGDKPRDLTLPSYSIGGRYDDTDQVFVGLRYLL